MTEQQTPDREKKIAEIREALEKIDRGDLFEIAMAYEKSGEWVRFLLDELTEERAAHNAHVTELCELEKENRKLRQEREKLIEGLRYLMKELGKLSVKPENGTAIHAYKKMRNILKEIGVTVDV